MRGPHRCIAADSYFASVQVANKMLEEEFNFLRPVKTCHCEFPKPKQFLEGLEMVINGLLYQMGHDDGRVVLIATIWVDRDRIFLSAHAKDRTRAIHNIPCDGGSWMIPILIQHQLD